MLRSNSDIVIKCIPASGSVYGWGRGLGHLGAGGAQDKLAPTLIEVVLPSEDDEISSQSSQSEKTRGESMQRDYREAQRSRITQIAAGAYHSLALAGATPSCYLKL